MNDWCGGLKDDGKGLRRKERGKWICVYCRFWRRGAAEFSLAPNATKEVVLKQGTRFGFGGSGGPSQAIGEVKKS